MKQLTTFLIAAAAALFLVPVSQAQEMHDPKDPSHWYDFYCCHLQDCGPVTNWEKVEGGWIVTNKQGLAAFLHKDYMKDDHLIKKPSRDAEFHVCITLDMRQSADGKGHIQCLYIPMNT